VFSILFQIVSGALISDLPGNLLPVLTGCLTPVYHVIILLLRGAKLCRDFADLFSLFALQELRLSLAGYSSQPCVSFDLAELRLFRSDPPPAAARKALFRRIFCFQYNPAPLRL
jgi:hypothetical protein